MFIHHMLHSKQWYRGEQKQRVNLIRILTLVITSCDNLARCIVEMDRGKSKQSWFLRPAGPDTDTCLWSLAVW